MIGPTLIFDAAETDYVNGWWPGFVVEGIEPSQSLHDVGITATFTKGHSVQDTVRFTVMQTDSGQGDIHLSLASPPSSTAARIAARGQGPAFRGPACWACPTGKVHLAAPRERGR